jgi:hypothetical protein
VSASKADNDEAAMQTTKKRPLIDALTVLSPGDDNSAQSQGA